VSGKTASVTFKVVAPSLGASSADYGDPSVDSGVLESDFLATAIVTPPAGYSGTVTWAQVLGTFSFVATGSGMTKKTCGPPNSSPWLDGGYPAASGGSFIDEPSVTVSALPAGYTNATFTGTFSTIVLWRPTVSGTSFPVPLESVSWTMNAAATLGGSVWTGSGTTTGPATFSGTTAYPTWSSIAPIHGMTCQYTL
jgi:hypothetical protein